MASNASSYFLKIISTKSGEVKGDATAKAGKDQIEVRSFEFFADRPWDLATGAPAGRFICRNLEFVIPICGASAILLGIFFTNENIKSATLTCFRADTDGKEVQYLQWVFTDARIASYKVASEERFPYDTFQLVYAKASYNYAPKGTSTSWDGIGPSST